MRLLRAALILLLTFAAAADEIVPGVHVIRGGQIPGGQPDGNSVLLMAPDGVVVVDTGRHAEHTDSVIALANGQKRPIVAVINTHWHLDHVGGNARIRDAFPAVSVYATGALSKALTGFLANYRKQLMEAIEKQPESPGAETLRTEVALIDAGPRLLPEVTIGGSGMRSIGGRDLLMNVELNAVTEADLWLFDPGTGVLIAGDLVTLPAPFLDTACAPNWQRALDRLAKTDFDLLVPGHGAPLTRRQFETYRTSFNGLVKCANSDAPAADCATSWMKETAALSVHFDEKFTRAMMDYYVALLRADEGKRARGCA